MYECDIGVALKNKCSDFFLLLSSLLLHAISCCSSGGVLTTGQFNLTLLSHPSLRPHATLNCLFHIAFSLAAFYILPTSLLPFYSSLSSSLSLSLSLCKKRESEYSGRVSYVSATKDYDKNLSVAGLSFLSLIFSVCWLNSPSLSLSIYLSLSFSFFHALSPFSKENVCNVVESVHVQI